MHNYTSTNKQTENWLCKLHANQTYDTSSVVQIFTN